MHRLENPVRPYAWGSPDLIPAFLGGVADGSPVAEVWMGAHPDDPSTAIGAGDSAAAGGAFPSGAHPTLDAVVAADPEGTLGEATAARFGRLPFLVKLLGAGAPLSLQVHPNAEQAAAGHAREVAVGTPAHRRSYGDPWHKPEVALALTDFRALAGVREPAESLAALEDGHDDGGVDACASATLVAFRDALRGGGEGGGDGPAAAADAVRAAVAVALEAGPAETAGACEALASLAARRARRGGAASLRHAEDDACVVELQRSHPADVGVLLSVLLHHVTLAPGQALFVRAGQLHAYRSGLAVEVMASSDNVLRAGLTRKSVDVAAVLEIVDLAPVPVPLLEGTPGGPGTTTFAPPVDDFALDVVDVARLPAGALPATGSPRIALVLDGEVSLVQGGAELEVARGGAVFVPAGAAVVATSTGRPAPARLALARVGGS